MKHQKRKTHRNRADKFFSLLVRARGHCESCGTTQNLQCAHIVSRRYMATRVDLDNAFCLCRSCHLRYTNYPLEFEQFVIETVSAAHHARLKKRALDGTGIKVDWKAKADELETRWNRSEQ